MLVQMENYLTHISVKNGTSRFFSDFLWKSCNWMIITFTSKSESHLQSTMSGSSFYFILQWFPTQRDSANRLIAAENVNFHSAEIMWMDMTETFGSIVRFQ